ncbi:MAG: riboflavin biosynthesis protein RibF, partial [Spartobacteria bacterium]|nr:riboflavin biosynthesis protein RibF [Spartobacteria bacterium]
MRILHSIDELGEIGDLVVLAAGVFDGVHLGHQAVLRTAQSAAREIGGTAVALTFDPHPAAVLRPSEVPQLLTSTESKLSLFESLGIENTLVVRFDADFAATEASDFILQLTRATPHLAGICIGRGWMFGKNRSGNASLLREMGQGNGFFTTEVEPFKIVDAVVSSTLIRKALLEGDLRTAETMLGRNYSLSGVVLPGAQLGRKLGFPTANLGLNNELLPPNGVYVVRVNASGQSLNGVANLGTRPTIGENSKRVLEVH